jgi:hypothetical protein
MDFENELKLLQLMLSRLERISVDSRLAHQASGLRGSLLTIMDNIDKRQIANISESEQRLIDRGFYILERAASERVQGRRASRE